MMMKLTLLRCEININSKLYSVFSLGQYNVNAIEIYTQCINKDRAIDSFSAG